MIVVREDIVTPEELQPCIDWLHRAPWSFGWKSDKDISFGHWNVDIARGGVTNTVDVSSRLPGPFKYVWKKMLDQFPGSTLVRCYANQHTFGTEGYIHTDTERPEDQTCVIYLNKEWDVNWGGETSFYSLDRSAVLLSVIPKIGRMVVFSGAIPHCAKPLTRICNKSRTTLMFKFAVDPKSVYQAEVLLKAFLINIGANQKPHKNGSLMDHLVRVFHLMKSVGIGDILAVAGGLHSVFGTNAYKDACLPWESTLVQESFGDEVDRIVRLFARLNRPQDLMDGSPLSEQDLFLMRCIETANLYDQGELDRHPHLVEFARQFQ